LFVLLRRRRRLPLPVRCLRCCGLLFRRAVAGVGELHSRVKKTRQEEEEEEKQEQDEELEEE
jgi:hypothetical protein